MPAIKIHEYMANAAGARNLGFDAAEGVHVLVQPASAEYQKRAQQVAIAFADAALEQQAQQLALDALQKANESLADQLRKARARIAELETANKAAVTGRRRFFGPVLLLPPRPGDWSGEVWLVDPVKREYGRALVFDSLAEVRRMHPELWVVGVVDGGVLLDAFGSP
ncbi:MAG: hypothetical protein ACOZQL_10800 [Myxococcota bacterium]